MNIYNMSKLSSTAKWIFAAGLAITVLANPAGQQAHASDNLVQPAGNVPVPTPRPPYSSGAVAFMEEIDPQTSSSVSAIGNLLQRVTTEPQAGNPGFGPITGRLKEGLDALSAKNPGKALSIRAGMTPGSLERKILAWSIAVSGLSGTPSAEIAKIATDLNYWPGGRAMRINAEQALAAENPDAREIINGFNGNRPESIDGAILLARAYLATGNRKAANAVIAPIWRRDALSNSQEKRILGELGQALTRDDHQVRMDAMFYRERVNDGLAVAKLAGRAHLANAWAAVIRNEKNAAALLKSVPAAERRDPAYLFASLKFQRRAGNYKAAAQLLLQAPKNQAALVDPDEWWIEGRIISRALIDQGDARTAYRIAAAHQAESATSRAEAEFHSGWFALRFLNDRRQAARHFEQILKITSTPISQSRGHYWLGRSLDGAQRTEQFRAAARYPGTYYGQLAAQALGTRNLPVSSPKPGDGARNRLEAKEFYRAIEALENAGYEWRADILYRALADELTDPDELALLAWRAEKRGDHTLALQIGKTAHSRGLEVDTVSWPVGAIPAGAKIGDTGRALAYAVARQESAFNVGAVSPANAKGLLQLLPGTAKMMAKKVGVKYSSSRLVTDGAYNATLGSAYLSEQLDKFGNSYILTFAGYNAGPRRVEEWIETYGDPRGKPLKDVVDWVERIPFTETRNYVQRVMENYQVYKVRIAQSPLDIAGDLRFGRR